MSESDEALLGIGPALEHQYLTLRQMVDVGELMLEPDAAARAARACQELKEKLAGHAQMAIHLSKRVDFGQCSEGWALSEKFSQKAKGTPLSLYEVLIKTQEILDNMSDTYLAAGRAYAEQERVNANKFSQN